MITREKGANGVVYWGDQSGHPLTVPPEPFGASEEAVTQRIRDARDIVWKRLLDSGEPALARAIADTSVAACLRQDSSLVEGELHSTRFFRPFDSTGDARLSTVYLAPWCRFDGTTIRDLANEIEQLLGRAVNERRIPHPDVRIKSLWEDVLPVACARCGQKIRVLRIFSENIARYDCGMCRRCNEVLCPACFPEHSHKFKVRERCRKCGGTGIFSQLVTKKQNFWQKFVEVRPEYDLVTQTCAACEGRGFSEI